MQKKKYVLVSYHLLRVPQPGQIKPSQPAALRQQLDFLFKRSKLMPSSLLGRVSRW
jgi:hypothetical protein